MKRRNFLRGVVLLAAIFFALGAIATVKPDEPETQVFEWRVYHFKNTAQKRQFDDFCRDVLIPSINGYGVKVGAFEEYGQAEPPKGYYLFAYSSIVEYQRVKNMIWSHVIFLEKSKDYFNSTEESGAYEKFETYLVEATDAFPTIQEPYEKRGLRELVICQSNNEESVQRNVRFFNIEQMGLFKKFGLNATFFGEVLAGPQMPALIYMLRFKDMDERNTNWKNFNESKEWNKLCSKKEYGRMVSKVSKLFLLPMDYSQF